MVANVCSASKWGQWYSKHQLAPSSWALMVIQISTHPRQFKYFNWRWVDPRAGKGHTYALMQRASQAATEKFQKLDDLIGSSVIAHTLLDTLYILTVHCTDMLYMFLLQSQIKTSWIDCRGSKTGPVDSNTQTQNCSFIKCARKQPLLWHVQ